MNEKKYLNFFYFISFLRSNIKYINTNVALTKYIYTVFVTRCDVKCGGRCVTSM